MVRVNLFRQITNILYTGDALNYHNNQPFSTKDRDNDEWPGVNCADTRHGGFWYRSCALANLNGEYLGKGVHRIPGVWWNDWKAYHYSLKRVEMKIKPN